MFQAYQILINNQPTELGYPIPEEVYALDVKLFMPIQIPDHQVPHLKQWLNTVIDHLQCDYVTYNDVLIPTSELTKF